MHIWIVDCMRHLNYISSWVGAMCSAESNRGFSPTCTNPRNFLTVYVNDLPSSLSKFWMVCVFEMSPCKLRSTLRSDLGEIYWSPCSSVRLYCVSVARFEYLWANLQVNYCLFHPILCAIKVNENLQSWEMYQQKWRNILLSKLGTRHL